MKYFSDSEEAKILHLLNQNNRIVRCQMLKSSQQYKFTPMQLLLIKFIGENKKVTLTEVAEELGLSNSTTSGIVDRLEKQGIIKRERSQEDRRIVYLFLTTETMKYSEELHSSIETFMKNIFDKVPKEEKQNMIKALEYLYDILSQ